MATSITLLEKAAVLAYGKMSCPGGYCVTNLTQSKGFGWVGGQKSRVSAKDIEHRLPILTSFHELGGEVGNFVSVCGEIRFVNELREVQSKQDGAKLFTRSVVLVDLEGDDRKQFEITFWGKDAQFSTVTQGEVCSFHGVRA